MLWCESGNKVWRQSRAALWKHCYWSLRPSLWLHEKYEAPELWGVWADFKLCSFPTCSLVAGSWLRCLPSRNDHGGHLMCYMWAEDFENQLGNKPQFSWKCFQNGCDTWTSLWFGESDEVFLWQPLVLLVSVVHMPVDNTGQTWPLAFSVCSSCHVKAAVTSRHSTNQKQLMKYACKFSGPQMYLPEYLRHTQHNWGSSWLHLFCITVKQTMKELSAASSKVLLSACHLLTWFLQVGKTVQAILCSSFCFKLKMLQDYYVMRHHEKYPFRRLDWHFPPASTQCHSSIYCWYLCRHRMRSSRAGRDAPLCSLTCTE